MMLAVDIGNTNIVLGIFKGNKLISKQRILSDRSSKVKVSGNIDAAIISSVVPGLNLIVSKKIRNKTGVKPVLLNWKMLKGIKIAVRKKEQIGIDRLVNAIAAKKLHRWPLIIIDFGTATTFCAVDKRGSYIGGAITSGLAISRDILYERTAKLPKIDIGKPKAVIGRDTVEAMKSGLYYGYVDMVEGMIKRFKAEIGKNAKVIATGGLSGIIASGTDKIDVVDPDLTLKGLNIIYNEIRDGR
jgi:type III pantothenate kinase